MNTIIKAKIRKAFEVDDIDWRDEDNIASIVVDGHTVYELIRICLDHKLQQELNFGDLI